MRVFWHNGSLQIVPECDREVQLLSELTNNLTIGKPLETQHRISSGNTPLGDGLFELLVGNEETRPSSLAVKTNNQQKIIRIDKLP
jgi:hypothetical protein